jgi:hypothetical protein
MIRKVLIIFVYLSQIIFFEKVSEKENTSHIILLEIDFVAGEDLNTATELV